MVISMKNIDEMFYISSQYSIALAEAVVEAIKDHINLRSYKTILQILTNCNHINFAYILSNNNDFSTESYETKLRNFKLNCKGKKRK